MEIAFVAIGAALVVFAGLAVAFSPAASFRRAMKTLPITRIADARDGERVRIVGEVQRPTQTLASPISGRPCVAYQVLVQVRVTTDRSNYWRTLIKLQDAIEHVIEDATGRARIVPDEDPELLVHQDLGDYANFLKDPSPELERFLAKHGESTQGAFFKRTLRYKEGAIEVGDRVAAAGIARWERDPNPPEHRGSFREAPRRLVLGPSRSMRLHLTDDASAIKS